MHHDMHVCVTLQAIGRMKREVAAEFPERQQIEAEFMQLDLASFHSVRTFIQAFKERNHPLDILINNAGVSYVHHGEISRYVVPFLFNGG